jgi:hypothetical protein
LLCNADAAAAQLAHLHCPQEWLEIQKEREREKRIEREREKKKRDKEGERETGRERERFVGAQISQDKGRMTCCSATPVVLACPPNLATSCFFVCASIHRAQVGVLTAWHAAGLVTAWRADKQLKNSTEKGKPGPQSSAEQQQNSILAYAESRTSKASLSCATFCCSPWILNCDCAPNYTRVKS